MKASQENMMRALDSARGAGQKPKVASQPPTPLGETASPMDSPREPRVFFSIEKKVGDATLHVSGGPGEEKAAMDAINDAKARFK